MDYTLTLTDVADEEVRKAILAPLVAYNDSQAGPSQGRPLVIQVKDASEAVIGGLWGYTGYEWLFTQLLVVPPNLRGKGVGTRLMQLAESEAMARGCRGAWLDTFEFQARAFYERLGYTCFGELPDYPAGFSRFFMKKQLAALAP
jgi:GNAT superfamily N-acetyltransferase